MSRPRIHALGFAALILEEPALFEALSAREQRSLGELLRDLFFAESPAPEDAAALARLSAALDRPPTLEARGLGLSYFPTARFSAPRFLDVEALPEAVRGLFYRPRPGLCAAFVDPMEFQYRSYENILPLDRSFRRRPALRFGLLERLIPGKDVFRLPLQASAEDRERVLALDGLGLYAAPLNRGSRGGQRFIFHAAGLAKALGRALKAALPADALEGFSHVNPVFRCNRFEPGDAPFREHIDTPYSDPTRGQVSRLTLLLYLTGGRGAPALKIDGLELAEIPAWSAFVFDQALAHSGAAFVDGAKVFLRAELVFEAPELGFAPSVAALFSKACYMTGESLVHPQLAGAVHAAFDGAAAGHWRRLGEETAASEPWVYKEFRGAPFLANGYDFWFLKDGGLGLEELAAITVLDALNCKVDGRPFRRLCRSELVEAGEAKCWPADYLKGRAATAVFRGLDKAALFPPIPAPSRGHCCPTHCRGGAFDAKRCEDVLELFTRARGFIADKVFAAPILMLGQELFLDRARFRVQRGKLLIFSDQALAPLNFAACWQDGTDPPEYIDVDFEIEAVQPLLPPILIAERDGCLRLSFDFFHNGWTARQERLPLPKIRDADRLEGGEEPWMEAASGLARRPIGGRPSRGARWWWRDSALLRELYPELG